MKVTHIILEEKIDEAPVSGIKQGLRKMGAKALAKVGAKNTAAGIAGKVDAGKKANELFTKFRQHLGTIGMNIKQVEASELVAWMKQNKLPTANVPQQGVLSAKQVEQSFLKAVQDSFRASGASQSQAAPVAQQTGTTATGQSQTSASQAKQTQIPADLQKKINALSPEQKQQLLGML